MVIARKRSTSPPGATPAPPARKESERRPLVPAALPVAAAPIVERAARHEPPALIPAAKEVAPPAPAEPHQPGELASAVGRNLVLARFALDVTQDRLATASKISRATIAQIESGNTDTRLGTLADLARALTISPSLLLLRPVDVTSLLHFVRRSSIERVLAKLSPQQLALMNNLRQTGFQKDLMRVAQLGIDAAAHAGYKTAGAVVGAGIGWAILPGIGTAVGTILGVALDAGARQPPDLEEGAGI